MIVLTSDWIFKVYNDSRNHTLAKYVMGVESINSRYPLGAEEGKPIHCSSSVIVDGRPTGSYIPKIYKTYLPTKVGHRHRWKAGTALTVDRIYIRKGAKDYSSVTFKTKVNGRVIRFFARLSDVNKIEFEV